MDILQFPPHFSARRTTPFALEQRAIDWLKLEAYTHSLPEEVARLTCAVSVGVHAVTPEDRSIFQEVIEIAHGHRSETAAPQWLIDSYTQGAKDNNYRLQKIIARRYRLGEGICLTAARQLASDRQLVDSVEPKEITTADVQRSYDTCTNMSSLMRQDSQDSLTDEKQALLRQIDTLSQEVAALHPHELLAATWLQATEQQRQEMFDIGLLYEAYKFVARQSPSEVGQWFVDHPYPYTAVPSWLTFLGVRLRRRKAYGPERVPSEMTMRCRSIVEGSNVTKIYDVKQRLAEATKKAATYGLVQDLFGLDPATGHPKLNILQV